MSESEMSSKRRHRGWRRRTRRSLCAAAAVVAAVLGVGLWLPGSAQAADTRIEPGIAWAQARLGSHDYDYWCLKFVSDAYKYGAGATMVGGYQTAKQAADGTGAAANAGTEPPRGAFVYYHWWGTIDGVYADYGHVGLSLGDGTIIEARSGVRITARGSVGLSYIGWAAPPMSPPMTDFGSPPPPTSSLMNVIAWNRADPNWANVYLDAGTAYPMGAYGNAVTCSAMLACYYGSGKNPGQLCQVLRANGGLDANGDLQWTKVPAAAGGTIAWVGTLDYSSVAADLNRINAELDAGFPLIALTYMDPYPNKSRPLWVVVTGHTGGTYYINDPSDGAKNANFNARYGDPAMRIYIVRLYHGTRVVDRTAPVTTVAGADELWHNVPVKIDLAAADNAGGWGMIGGSAAINYQIDGGVWQKGGGIAVPAPADHSCDGVHTIGYFSVDAAGNVEAARSATVRIDTAAPGIWAFKATARRGGVLKLRFKAADRLPSCGTAEGAIVIRRNGRTVKTYALRGVLLNSITAARAACRLKRGRYIWQVVLTDAAGNRSAVSRASLTVR